MRILGFGTYDTSKHPRIGVVLEGLRSCGDTVVEANRPLGLSTAQRVEMLQRPWLAYRLPARLILRWMQLVVTAWRGRRAEPIDAVIVGYMGHFDVVLARLLFRRAVVTLDLLILAADTARDRGVGSGLKLLALDLLDRLACGCAELVLVDTEEHAALLPPAARVKAVVAPVGALPSWFAARRVEPPEPGLPLRVVFFGLFTPLQGAPVVGQAIGLLAGRADIQFTIIGTGQDYLTCRRLAADNKRVTWTDWVDSDRLPHVVADHDVCLGIFGTTNKARRVVPNKVYQGAASGCAVITSDTAPQRRALGDAALFVEPGNPGALADALLTLAADRTMLATLKEASFNRSSGRFSPEVIVQELRLALAARSATALR
jgi:glycosyltransferase involved in cell wall biosynthesis